MRIRRLLCLFLSAALLFSLVVPASALQGQEATIEEVNEAMNTVADSIMELSDTAASGEASSLADIFKSFVDAAGTAQKYIATINNSVAFLKLIGVMTDSTQTKLNGILSQLQTIDERLSTMDDKLNDLTSAMSDLKASVEFNARTEKAILYEAIWRDFAYRYMEDGLDKLISQYNSMLRSGLMSWCNGSRNENNVDNSRIILLYHDGKLTFSDYNGIPASITDEDSWVILPAECLPNTFYYDVNSFNDSLADDIAGRISDIIAQERVSLFETHNYPALTEEGVGSITPEDIHSLAVDAVNTLIYRTASAKVNSDANFAGEVSRQFSNYCTHLQAYDDGIDSVLKTLYLTHAFEYSVASDLTDFCNRMIILTGTYGTFASHVLGMSHLITNEEKTAAVSQMTAAVETTKQAKENGITGNGNYCYITKSNLTYTTVTFSASAKLTAHYTLSNTAYTSYSAKEPAASYGTYPSWNVHPIGDTATIILMNTLQSNSITPKHDYFNENIGNNSVKDYGSLVTDFGTPQTLSFDGKTALHVKNAFGSYFKDNATITKLPDDASTDYTVFRKKISGSLYDLPGGTLTSNATLCAIGVYGESHFYWITDEGAFMGGPSDSGSFRDTYTVTKTGSDTSGVIRTHDYTVKNSYNILLSEPRDTNISTNGIYDPLASLEASVPHCEYLSGSYGSSNDDPIDSPITPAVDESGITPPNTAQQSQGADNTDSLSSSESDAPKDALQEKTPEDNAKLTLAADSQEDAVVENEALDIGAESQQHNPALPIIIAVAVLAAAVIFFAVYKNRKK